MNRDIPHLKIVVAACAVAIAGYAGFSIWIIWKFPDATMVGDIIGTWKTFAVAAFAFWIGSSSGGKANVPPTEPVPVAVVNPPNDPVNVEEQS